jgi:hypothetical protein
VISLLFQGGLGGSSKYKNVKRTVLKVMLLKVAAHSAILLAIVKGQVQFIKLSLGKLYQG